MPLKNAQTSARTIARWRTGEGGYALRSARHHKSAGYTMIEALLLITILGITAAAVGNSLIGQVDIPQANDNILQIDNQLVSEMETLRATYQNLPVGPVNSTVTIGGVAYTMTYDIEQAVPASGQGLQSTFLSLTVTIGNRSLNSLVSK